MTAHNPQFTSETAYLDLCDLLFSTWAQTVRRAPNYARVARSLLSNVHALYANQQACPVDYADIVRSTLARAARHAPRSTPCKPLAYTANL
jgi:hypothetical protein